MNRYARKNTNRLDGDETEYKLIQGMAVDRVPGSVYPLIGKNFVAAYGYMSHTVIPAPQEEEDIKD